MQIVRTKRYSRDIKRIGATVEDIAALEGSIASNPQAGNVIPDLAEFGKSVFHSAIGVSGAEPGQSTFR